ncbi:hypothetical protein ACLOJK_037714 [Asimina triloba]
MSERSAISTASDRTCQPFDPWRYLSNGGLQKVAPRYKVCDRHLFSDSTGAFSADETPLTVRQKSALDIVAASLVFWMIPKSREDPRRTAFPPASRTRCYPDGLSDVVRARKPCRPPASLEYRSKKALRRSADSRRPRRSPSHLLQILGFFTVKLQFEHMKVKSLWPSLSLTKVRMSLSNSKPGPFFRLYQYSFSQSSVGKDLKYADSHGWVKAERTSATIGITDHAQATSDVNSPVSGKVVEVNTELADSPGLVSHSLSAVHFKCSLMAVWDVCAQPQNSQAHEIVIGQHSATNF